jgi:hypothetical protein
LSADFRFLFSRFGGDIVVELSNPLWRLLIDFAVIAAIVWAIRHLAVATDRHVQKLGSDWPVAQGTPSMPASKNDGRGSHWMLVGELSYSYSVDGEYYAGVTHLRASNEDAAYEATRGWRDRKVKVRYMSSNPETSVLVVLDEQTKPVASRI